MKSRTISYRHDFFSVCMLGTATAACVVPDGALAHRVVHSPQRVSGCHRREPRMTVTAPRMTWSSDGRRAFYIVARDYGLGAGGTPSRCTLFSIGPHGAHPRRLIEWNSPGENHPDDRSIHWSPDGSRILMLILNFYPASSVNANGVQLVDFNAETGRRRWLSRPLPGEPSTGHVLPLPGYYTFTPDGRALLLTLGGLRQTWTNKRLVRIDYLTGKREVLTSASMASSGARWSPDGKCIALIAAPDSRRGPSAGALNTKPWKQQ